MKPRKDEIWTLGAFQEVPGARKEHGAFLCQEGMLHLQPPGAPDLTQKSSGQQRKPHLKTFPSSVPKAPFYPWAISIFWKAVWEHRWHELRSLYCDKDTEIGVCIRTNWEPFHQGWATWSAQPSGRQGPQPTQRGEPAVLGEEWRVLLRVCCGVGRSLQEG